MQKTTILRLLACTSLFMIVSLISTASFASDTTGTIRGTVTASGVPVGGVTLQLFKRHIKIPIRATKTNADGIYVFPKVTPGDYTLRTNLSGFEDEDCDIGAFPEITNIMDFALQPFSGKVDGFALGVKSILGERTVVRLINSQKQIYSETEGR